MKKMLSIILAICMITCIMSVNAIATNIGTDTNRQLTLGTKLSLFVKGSGITSYAINLTDETQVEIKFDITNGDAYHYDMFTITNTDGTTHEHHDLATSNVYHATFEPGTSYISITSWYGSEYDCTISVIPLNAKESTSTLTVNNVKVSTEAYQIGGNNFYKLRDIANALKDTNKYFNVNWDSINNIVNITTKTEYVQASNEQTADIEKTTDCVLSNAKLYVNGEQQNIVGYNINGNTYYRIRDIAALINFGVDWNGTTNTININTSHEYSN